MFGILTAAVLIYFIPSIVAICRAHLNATAIFLTNFLLGWTGIGWTLALIWSSTNTAVESPVRRSRKALSVTLSLVILLTLLVSWAALQPRPPHAAKVITPVAPAPAVRTGVPVPADELLGK